MTTPAACCCPLLSLRRGRARSATLSGRYPYHLGLYNNNEGTFSLEYKLLPALLKLSDRQPWRTHALGKWCVPL